MNKNDYLDLEITDIGINGEGIGKVDGLTFFVKNGVIGDFVQAVVTKMNKGYGYAKVLKILKPSPYRVLPECSEADRCGGCQIQTLSYEAQLEYKHKKVVADLERIGGFKVSSNPVIGMDYPYMYRNKAQYPVGLSKDGKIVTGFFAGRTHSIIEAENCRLGPEGSSEILGKVIEWMEENCIKPYDEVTGKGLVRHVLIRKSKAGDFLVCLIINSKKLPAADKLILKLSENPDIKSVSYNIQEMKGNTILGEKVVPVFGEPYIYDTIGNLKFQISPLSFYQVNPIQTEKLYGKALEFADLKGNEIVWDLYCGIGTISLFLSQKAGKVYGVEIVPDAVRDAKENAKTNGITNAEFFCGKAEEVVPELINADGFNKEAVDKPAGSALLKADKLLNEGARQKNMGKKEQVVVVDPPRKGCDPVLLDAILKIAPSKIVYVSCNPSTLARDLKILCEKDYEIKKVQPVDMFPHTVHVETVCLITKKNS